MSSEWHTCTLGQFVRLQRGHDLTASEQQPGNVPIMGSAGQNGTHNVALASGPGVVVGRSGASAGRVHFCEVDYWPHNTCLYVTDFLGNNPRFAYYLLQTLDLAAFNSGSAQPSLNRNFLYTIPVQLPERGEQDAIVALLQSLDDRITLLRETNTTLEAIAQALFKSWFIDFDPVRSKQEGRLPEGVDESTAALFPDAFEESEQGLVPRGWLVRSLDSIANYLNGLAMQKFPPESDDEYLPVIKIAQLRAGSTSGADRASFRLKPEYVVHDGDVLFSWSGTLEVELWCGGKGALNQHLFKVNSAEVPKWFYYLATRHFLPRFRDIAAHKATTMGHIQRKHLTEARLAIPPAQVLASLSELVAPLIERRIANSLQARYLASLRDTLLPRLISGQLRLAEAEAEALAA
ncbi:restriction endonuclease subunit S [Burkholderia pseudomallei]|uniref:restriction endonuclease subunit S n=1 Tax=Burkholderia pseudomallei TaxID=28450 RepID=UPI0005EA3AF2|nr:restriction endonuclease subunit S [Burkholderia pseudomallei]CAJ3267805.1 HsdS protein [Burkholderia pseudomallei]CAJ3509659.1 HsdS protein [Burkholderia pseudomallei]CAJ3831633.1 HsdS protein [Burkholderia pseudomallei]CAJ5636196.1 HsdS protein [Burkholderia pseudomallei]CAJ6831438.1 HsdS protein [Burkholderia pseudomallei]